MTLREAARRLIDVKTMRAPTRALLIGYVVMVALYDWQGFGPLSEPTVRNVKKQLKKLGIDPELIDLGPP